MTAVISNRSIFLWSQAVFNKVVLTVKYMTIFFFHCVVARKNRTSYVQVSCHGGDEYRIQHWRDETVTLALGCGYVLNIRKSLKIEVHKKTTLGYREVSEAKPSKLNT